MKQRLVSPLRALSCSLAFLLLNPGCTISVTDFKETAPDTQGLTGDTSTGVSKDTNSATTNTTTSGDVGTSTTNATTTGDVGTSNSGTTEDSGEGVTTNATTGLDPTSGVIPACEEFTDDPEQVPGEACESALGCEGLTQEECQTRFYEGESGVTVECRKGVIFYGSADEDGDSCEGDTYEVCRATIFGGQGEPPCDGFYREFEDEHHVLSLGCGIPIAEGFEGCYVDGGEPKVPACACPPPIP